MIQRYIKTAGVQLEPLGSLWVVFTPLSGQSSFLNDECVAVLEALDNGPASSGEVCQRLVASGETLPDEFEAAVTASWASLVVVGAVRAL